MLVVEPRSLLLKLNTTCTKALERAVSACIGARHYEVAVEHVLLTLLEDAESDVVKALAHYGIDLGTAKRALQHVVSDLRSGNPGKPVFSSLLFECVQDAWVFSSAELDESKVRSGALLARVALAPSRYTASELPFLGQISRDELRKDLQIICSGSAEAKIATKIGEGTASGDAGAGGSGDAARGTSLGKADGPLARFTSDLTERARRGELDPVFGRESEVRQVVDILSRRRKNNPIIVGEPGVGKTALVEGLAIRIAEGTVPDQLKQVHVLALDLGALQAGAGVKGEFESRLKGVIEEVKSSPKPIVLFIDEAHTIIGAGGQQGGSDAANLLKPALARGELRTIAATTWAEFKKYFEKDAALERRFQPVKVDEPSPENAILMMRGVAEKFAASHGIVIQDQAVVSAVMLSSRYISGRQLPDKAVDLLDTAAARVRVVRASVPAVIEDAQAEQAAVHRELAAYARDHEAGVKVDAHAKTAAEEKRDALAVKLEALQAKAAGQRAIVEKIDEHRKAIKAAEESGKKDDAVAARVSLETELAALAAIPKADLLVHADVDESITAAVISDWTGIPVGKMVKDDIEGVLRTEERLGKRVRGQDHALAAIAKELRAARAGLKPPQQPMGVFLLVGPSGVGKTETALGLADLLFGGERFLVTINMSEFQEKHTVAKLIGSPPGYVGYGEGGVLTEAVRQRPYSVVLLDEVEKADKEVLNLFYQVFDKGMLADGEGRVIDFKNTVIIMTSNLATDLITQVAMPGEPVPPIEEIVSLVKPVLSAHFKPALLARFTVVPYIPIQPEALAGITRMKVDGIVQRAKDGHGVKLEVDDKVIQTIADRCREVDAGARNIDHILRNTVLPRVSTEILQILADGAEGAVLRLVVDGTGDIVCERRSS
jgi:type VI secretion system protein VasG